MNEIKVVCNKTENGITKDRQYAVLASFTAIDNEKRYMIENDYRRVETYARSLFTVVSEPDVKPKAEVKTKENISLFEMMHLDCEDIEWIKIKVRKESR